MRGLGLGGETGTFREFIATSSRVFFSLKGWSPAWWMVGGRGSEAGFIYVLEGRVFYARGTRFTVMMSMDLRSARFGFDYDGIYQSCDGSTILIPGANSGSLPYLPNSPRHFMHNRLTPVRP